MPRLDFYVNYKIFVKIKLEESEVLIGRAEDCTVQLPDDRVSRHHAAILKTPDGYSIEDRSQNGTRVNDQMVHAARPLAPGDRIYIEAFTIIYQPDDAPVQNLGSRPTLVTQPRLKR